MRTVTAHLDNINDLTAEYINVYARRRAAIIEAARDGCTVAQIAAAAGLAPPAVGAILGVEIDSEGVSRG